MCRIKQVEKSFDNLTWRAKIWFAISKIFSFLGKLFAAAVILVAIGHFIPELRETIPQVYIFCEDVVLGVVNWAYAQINKFLL